MDETLRSGTYCHDTEKDKIKQHNVYSLKTEALLQLNRASIYRSGVSVYGKQRLRFCYINCYSFIFRIFPLCAPTATSVAL